MQRNTFPLKEHLKSKSVIEQLYAKGASVTVFPLRAVFIEQAQEQQEPVAAILINVAKKRFRHAVDRNLVKRRIREAYRLNRHPALDEMNGSDCRVDVAFIYVADRLMEYAAVERAMRRLLTAIARHYVPQTDQPEDESIVQSHP